MKRKLMVFVPFLFLTMMTIGQNDSITPILLDRSVLSGVGLQKMVIKDEPEKDFYQKSLYRGEDISIYVVSTETWDNVFTNFWFDEFIYMYHGEAIIKPKAGKTQLFFSGDYFFAPKGYTGAWEINAGEQLHYELSVISTKRADSTIVSASLEHELFDRSVLSGAHIQLDSRGRYSEVLREGVELTISLGAEKPSEHKIKASKEMLIQLLSGQVTVKDLKGVTQTFYTGDFFVFPKNLTATWTSEGHGLIKYITVQKTG